MSINIDWDKYKSLNCDMNKVAEGFYKFVDGSHIDLRFIDDVDQSKTVDITLFQLKTMLKQIDSGGFDIDSLDAHIDDLVDDELDEQEEDIRFEMDEKLDQAKAEIEFLRGEVMNLEERISELD